MSSKKKVKSTSIKSTKSNGHKDHKPTRASDGRTFVTVYLTQDQYERLESHVVPLGLPISTFLRTKGLEAANTANAEK